MSRTSASPPHCSSRVSTAQLSFSAARCSAVLRWGPPERLGCGREDTHWLWLACGGSTQHSAATEGHGTSPYGGFPQQHGTCTHIPGRVDAQQHATHKHPQTLLTLAPLSKRKVTISSSSRSTAMCSKRLVRPTDPGEGWPHGSSPRV